jgi:hypothetical protein
MDRVNSRTPFNPPTYFTDGGLQEVGVALYIGLFTAVKSCHTVVHVAVCTVQHATVCSYSVNSLASAPVHFGQTDRILLLSKHLPC